MHNKDPSDKFIKPIWSTPVTIMEGSDIEELFEEVYKSLLKRFEMTSEKLEKSNYIFKRITEMTYHCHMIDLVRGNHGLKHPNGCTINTVSSIPKMNMSSASNGQSLLHSILMQLEHILNASRSSNRLLSNTTGMGLNFQLRTHTGKRQNPNVELNVYFSEKRI